MQSTSAILLQIVLLLSILTPSVRGFQPTAVIATSHVIASSAAVVPTASLPILAILAEVVDDYEYGAVDAPIGIAWVGGILAVLTATLPFFLQSGEKAFEEIKDRDADTFGKRNDLLKKRK
jgi:hypothetical protein